MQMGWNPSWPADSAAIWTLASPDRLIQKAVCLQLLQLCPLQAICQRYLPLQQSNRHTSINNNTMGIIYLLHPLPGLTKQLKWGGSHHNNKLFIMSKIMTKNKKDRYKHLFFLDRNQFKITLLLHCHAHLIISYFFVNQK